MHVLLSIAGAQIINLINLVQHLAKFEDDAPHVHLIFALEVCSFACSKNSPSYVVRFQNPKHLVPLISLSLVLELHHEIQVLDA
eukprot:3564345-Rhodomonas_salina.3